MFFPRRIGSRYRTQRDPIGTITGKEPFQGKAIAGYHGSRSLNAMPTKKGRLGPGVPYIKHKIQ